MLIGSFMYMNMNKEKWFFIAIIATCIVSVALAYYIFVIMSKEDVALSSFF
jgi:hypothetical protein